MQIQDQQIDSSRKWYVMAAVGLGIFVSNTQYPTPDISQKSAF
jgi:hypothetical protein